VESLQDVKSGARVEGEAEVVLEKLALVHRRDLPKDIFQRKPSVFVKKFAFAFALIGIGAALVLANLGPIADVVGIVVIGAIYAHLVELQHECLHQHAFRSRRLNRVFGFMCGMFMVSSYSHYRYEHLAHHANLGTSKNKEFFNYRFKNLDTVWGFVKGALHLGRYTEVLKSMGRALTGRPVMPGGRAHENKRLREEYLLLVAMAAATVAVGFVFDAWVPILLLWALPNFLVAEPCHFLIEMPEHFGLNTQTDPDVRSNTRTINATRIGAWYTNYNNLHTAHHYHYGVPMVNVPRLHDIVTPEIQVIEESYPAFFKRVLRGEWKYTNFEETCMTR
jgi:fatty acid desaturase